VHPKKKLAGLTNTTTTSDCQTPSGQLPGDKPGKNIRWWKLWIITKQEYW